jgi:hypothetical protein
MGDTRVSSNGFIATRLLEFGFEMQINKVLNIIHCRLEGNFYLEFASLNCMEK